LLVLWDSGAPQNMIMDGIMKEEADKSVF
jgi:hypothetical protein